MSSTLAAQTKINKDVPYGLTVAAAWSWRLVAVVIGWGAGLGLHTVLAG